MDCLLPPPPSPHHPPLRVHGISCLYHFCKRWWIDYPPPPPPTTPFHKFTASHVCITSTSDDGLLTPLPQHRLVGLVVKASASRAEDSGFESRLRRDFSGIESYQWLKNWHSLTLIGTHASDLKKWLPCQAPGVIGSVLGLAGPLSVYCDWVRWKSLVCNFYLSVAARKIVWADPSLRYTLHVAGTLSKQANIQPTPSPVFMASHVCIPSSHCSAW